MSLGSLTSCCSGKCSSPRSLERNVVDIEPTISHLRLLQSVDSMIIGTDITFIIQYYKRLTLSGSKLTRNPIKVNPSELSLDKCGIRVWQNALASSPVSLLRSRDELCCPSPKKNTSVHCILNTFLRVKSQPLWTLTLGKESSSRPSIGLHKL